MALQHRNLRNTSLTLVNLDSSQAEPREHAMFHIGRISSRFATSAAFASASAAVALSAHKFPVRADEPAAPEATLSSKKRVGGGKEAALADFDLFAAYRVHFGENVKKPLTNKDVEAILLHCGILDPEMSVFFFNALVAFDERKKKQKGTKVKSTYGKAEGQTEKTVSYSSFLSLCHTFFKGDDLAKWEVMFDFMDPDRSGTCDKNEVSVTMRHLLWLQTNWYGEEILYDGPFDLDLYFNVPTEAIAQLKANRFAHEMVMSCHGGGRKLTVTKKQFVNWMTTGGKNPAILKGLFSVFGAYPAIDYNTTYDDE